MSCSERQSLRFSERPLKAANLSTDLLPPTLQAPLLPRLGLLSLACSDGKVLLFSLPHPEALLAQQPPDAMKPAIYKVQCLATLQVGSVQASDPSECGQCLSLAWMPTRPHHHLAAGYYNGKNQDLLLFKLFICAWVWIVSSFD